MFRFKHKSHGQREDKDAGAQAGSASLPDLGRILRAGEGCRGVEGESNGENTDPEHPKPRVSWRAARMDVLESQNPWGT